MDQPKISSRSRIHRLRQSEEDADKKPKRLRHQGKLMRVMNLPVEVFLEIVFYLGPLDLLHMSRVSKQLRRTLLSRSIRSIWVNALKGIDSTLPDCPDDMSEPQYLSMLLERDCMACGVNRGSWSVSYAARIRFCGACWNVNVKSGTQLAREHELHRDTALLEAIVTLLPVAKHFIRSEEPQEIPQCLRDPYYEPEFVAVVKQYKDLRARGGLNDPSLQQFLDARAANTIRRLEFFKLVDKQQRAARDAKARAQNDARDERRTAICEKLKELGYEIPDYLSLSNMEFFRLIEQPRKLTPRIWNTIQPKLIALLEDARVSRLAYEFEKKWQLRRAHLRAIYVSYLESSDGKRRSLPVFEGVIQLPSMIALLTDKEPDEPMTVPDFIAIKDALVKEVDEYRLRLLQHLAKLATKAGVKRRSKSKGKQRATAAEPGSDPDPDVDLAILDLPTSVFVSNEPGIGGVKMSSSCVLHHWQHGHQWNLNKISLAGAKARSCAQSLLEALDLPEDTTMTNLHDFVNSQPGEPVCSCDFPFELPKSHQGTIASVYERLYYHIIFYARMSDDKNPVHRITFSLPTQPPPQ